MKLVIAEKPSVASDLARVLPGTFTQHDGYWEGPGYLISWAVGHLLQLAEPEDYDPALKNWQLADLPILPQEFRRRPRSGQRKRLQLLKKLARRPDVEGLINACDAAREGELIFREIEAWLGCSLPVERLWLQSMTPDAIRATFAEMLPESHYDGLGWAAYSRAEADWLIGMNATRAVTKRLKGRRERGVWSAGRVQTPTLALLVHRELKVLAHVPVPYWRLRGRFEANGHEYKGLYRHSRSGRDAEKIWKREDAEALLALCQGKGTRVEERVTESRRPAPPLYSLTALQKEANTRFGMSARRTLGAAQRLYESHKVLTYPRTDSSALPSDYRGQVQANLQALAKGAAEAAFLEKGRSEALAEGARTLLDSGLRNTQRNFDDSRVGDHFAIMPTGSFPETPLGGDDAKVFELVLRRFIASFLPPSTWQKVSRATRVGIGDPATEDPVFYTESRRLVVPGWQAVDRRPPASENLPELGDQDQGRTIEVLLEEDATRPPARYTEAGLLKGMETASDLDLEVHENFEDEEVLGALKEKGLGTPATRADIIEALIAKGYVNRSGKTLRASAKGITLIGFLERLRADQLAKAELTAEMEFKLYQVEAGKVSREQFMKEVEDLVRHLIGILKEFDYEDLYREDEPVGVCPRDGAPVREGLKGYRCTRPAVGDRYEVVLKGLGKESPRPIREVAEELATALRSLAGVAEVEADPKRINAKLRLRMTENGEVEAVKKRIQAAVAAAAPEDCLKEWSVAAVEPDSCGFTIWKEFRGRYINRPVVEKLLKDRDTGPIEGFASMRGDFYAGRIRLGEDSKMEFEAVKGYKGSDDTGPVAPELVSFPVDPSPYLPCPRCGKGGIVETPTHFECREDGSEKGCGLRIPRSVCKRELRREDLRGYFDPAIGHTEWIEDFISRKGRPFTARLVRQENGRHGFEFKPREPRKAAKSSKKVRKKKSAKKVSRKKGAKTAASPAED